MAGFTRENFIALKEAVQLSFEKAMQAKIRGEAEQERIRNIEETMLQPFPQSIDELINPDLTINDMPFLISASLFTNDTAPDAVNGRLYLAWKRLIEATLAYRQEEAKYPTATKWTRGKQAARELNLVPLRDSLEDTLGYLSVAVDTYAHLKSGESNRVDFDVHAPPAPSRHEQRLSAWGDLQIALSRFDETEFYDGSRSLSPARARRASQSRLDEWKQTHLPDDILGGHASLLQFVYRLDAFSSTRNLQDKLSVHIQLKSEVDLDLSSTEAYQESPDLLERYRVELEAASSSVERQLRAVNAWSGSAEGRLNDLLSSVEGPIKRNVTSIRAVGHLKDRQNQMTVRQRALEQMALSIAKALGRVEEIQRALSRAPSPASSAATERSSSPEEQQRIAHYNFRILDILVEQCGLSAPKYGGLAGLVRGMRAVDRGGVVGEAIHHANQQIQTQNEKVQFLAKLMLASSNNEFVYALYMAARDELGHGQEKSYSMVDQTDAVKTLNRVAKAQLLKNSIKDPNQQITDDQLNDVLNKHHESYPFSSCRKTSARKCLNALRQDDQGAAKKYFNKLNAKKWGMAGKGINLPNWESVQTEIAGREAQDPNFEAKLYDFDSSQSFGDQLRRRGSFVLLRGSAPVCPAPAQDPQGMSTGTHHLTQ